jgi:flagellar hook-associated protein 1 FlgK
VVNFVSLHTALTGIRASQVGLDTASHNVANAQTPGYSRQRLELSARDPFASAVGLIGTGADVTRITRARDEFLDRRARGAEAEVEHQGVRAQLLGRTEAVMAEPEQGLSAELGAVWDAFEDLALDPADGAARQQVVSALDGLSARVRTVAAGWDALEADAAVRAQSTVREAGDLLARLAELNQRIPVASFRGHSPNDLADERDVVADRLAALLGATATGEQDGTVTLRLGGVALVEGTTAQRLALGAAPGYAVTLEADGTAVAPGGRLGGLRSFLTGDLPRHRAALDAFVGDLAGVLNDRHAQGYAQQPPGAPGGPLLTLDTAVGAARTLALDAAVAADPRRLAAAGDAAVSPQDGRNATSLANLRTDLAGGTTLDGRVGGLVVALAGDVAAAARAADAADGLRVAASSARSAVTGVSLDEELVTVVQYQRSLEAASRVMTAVDEALDVLINRTGIVGR